MADLDQAIRVEKKGEGEGECFNLQAARLERIGGKLVAAIPMRLRLERPGISGIGISITRVSNQI